MGAYSETIPKSVIKWILEQKVFWVATAPLSAAGHVNVSPKGGATFGVPDDKTFWYMELTGSGNETLSHLYEPGNGRITIQLNAFEGPPRILRMYGHGRVLERGTQGYDAFVAQHQLKTIPATRSIIIVDIHQVGTSCGYSVPYYDFKEYRPTLESHFQKMDEKYQAGDEGKSMPKYWALKNSWSVDGLPGMKIARQTMKSDQITPLQKMVGSQAVPAYRRSGGGFSIQHIVLAALLGALLASFVILHGTQFADGLTHAIPQDAKKMIWAPLATLHEL